MDNMIVSVNPHIHSKDSTQTIMRDVLIALVPALIASIIFFGFRALLVECVCVIACVACEWIFQLCCKRKNTICDLSAAVTGLILAFNLPVDVPVWQAIVGSIFAIIVVKQLFGGIGKNFANPAITARVFMLIAFSGEMTQWAKTRFMADAVSSATPLALLSGAEGVTGSVSTLDLFLGNCGGSLGETCALALLIGFVYLLVRKIITWHTPVAFVATVFVLSLIKGGPIFAVNEILAGGLFLGAIFMATDYTTTPATSKGRVVFGIGCGLITCLIRFFGAYPEGVSFSILFMNILTPYISKLTASKPFGGVKA